MISADLQTMFHVLSLSMVAGTPLMMAAFCCTPFKKRVAGWLSLAAVPAFLAALTVPGDMIVEVPWFFMGDRMGLDETGRIFLFLSAFIWFLGSFNCSSLLNYGRNRAHFPVFFLIAMAGNFGLILARGMLGYYLFFALMSFAAYGLVVHNGTDDAKKAGRLYLVLVMIGEVALFTALIILAQNTGSLSIEDITGGSYQSLILALLFIGFGVKIGALPLHSWMMPAYQAAPIPAAAVLAGSMVNAGIFGWMRFLPLGRISCPQEAGLLVAAGALAAVYGIIIGLKSKQPGAVLGSSSISQMGLITVIFGLGLLDQDAGLHAAPVLILYAVHHSLAKSSLFFGYDLVKNQRRKLSRLQMAAIMLPAMALAGLPFTSGAISKGAFKELAVYLGEPWYGLSSFFLPITAMGTTLLMLHFVQLLRNTVGTDNSRTTKNIVFAASLIAVAITLWLWPEPRSIENRFPTGAKLIQALWPVAAGGLFFLVWRRFVFFEKVPDDDQKKQTRFDVFVITITRLLQEKEWQIPQPGRLAAHLTRVVPKLRKSEKIMGRWRVAGLSYLALSLCLLYLLL